MLNNSLLRKFSSIRLTEQESKGFAALIEASEAMGKKTVLRAAGGWVRDKLLGGESSDIDIALDNVPGDEFAQFLHDRECSNGNISSIGVVKENPEQSKHIRTASFRFYGLDFDINNLRSETYTEHSRIPEVKFAKHPSEDAFRRDFTINALYYNLNTKEIEDYTGTGLSDLECGIIRTPLPAARTFVDDPLRVLRSIRFASRFSFTLDEDIKDAWGHEDVRAGLMNKVSRERIGVEICKMMRDPRAGMAVEHLLASGLIGLILHPPTDSKAPSLAGVSAKDYEDWKKAWASSDKEEYDRGSFMSKVNAVQARRFLSNTESFYFNTCVLLVESVKGKASPNAALVARLSLKLSSADAKAVGNILSSLVQVQSVFGQVGESAAVSIGRLIRGVLKEHFRAAMLVYLVSDPSINEVEMHRKFDSVSSIIAQYSLEGCHEWKPLIDGAEMQKLLGIKPGKKIQELLLTEFDMMFAGQRDKATIKDRLIAENDKIV